MTKFKPPTLEEVEKYVNKKDLFVDPAFFMEYFTEGNWHDSQGKPVRNWKQKLLTWHRKRVETGRRCLCYCGKVGVYLAGYDDTGKPYFRCVNHKPNFKPSLPKEMTEGVLKTVDEDTESVSNKTNIQIGKLKHG